MFHLVPAEGIGTPPSSRNADFMPQLFCCIRACGKPLFATFSDAVGLRASDVLAMARRNFLF
jgi:hypothetical protein